MILVADDDADIRDLVATKLELGGYEVRAFGDGPAALAGLSRVLDRVETTEERHYCVPVLQDGELHWRALEPGAEEAPALRPCLADVSGHLLSDDEFAAVAAAQEHRPDVCLLDLEMPGLDGVEAAQEILRSVPTKVVIFTRHARPGVLRRALAEQVSGFVPKSTPAEELAVVLRQVVAGRRYVDPEIAASALTAEHSPLTERELDQAVVFTSTQIDADRLADRLAWPEPSRYSRFARL